MSFPSGRRRIALPKWARTIDADFAAAVNRSSLPEWADSGFRSLSRAADHGVLWGAIAVVLFAGGRRRAAVRGLGSLAVASFIANALGKSLIGGGRPVLDAVPVARRIRRHPTSPSFPSGHSASAAAFGAGVALESLGAGAVIAPLAASVGYSRVHVGAHWVSDVIGGALLGIGVAIAGALLVPAKPRLVRPAGAPPIELPALPDGAGLLVFVNPRSGREAHRLDPAPELRRRLPRAVVHRLADGDDLDAIIARHPQLVALGVHGGDGTVAAVAGVTRRADLPLLVLPGGTFNHFARTVGAGTVGDAIDAVRSGSGRAVDIAELTVGAAEPFTVLNTASVGIYPTFVAEREKYERRLGKPLAAVIASVRALALSDPVELTIDGRVTRAWSVFVGVNRYRGGAAPLSRERLDDGVLDVRILHARGAVNRTRATAALALGRRTAATIDRLPWWEGPSVVESFETGSLTASVRATHDNDPGFARDGESSTSAAPGTSANGESTSSITIVPAGLRVYAAVAG